MAAQAVDALANLKGKLHMIMINTLSIFALGQD